MLISIDALKEKASDRALQTVPLPELFQAFLKSSRPGGTDESVQWLRLLTMHPGSSSYVRTIAAEPVALGRMRRGITPGQKRTVKAILDGRRAEFEGTLPPRADVYAQARTLSPEVVRSVRVLVLVSKYVSNDSRKLESEVLTSLTAAADAAGVEARFFPQDNISYRTQNDQTQADLHRLDEEVKSYKPDIVLIDVNYEGGTTPLNAAWLQALKQRHGFKAFGLIYDWNISVTAPFDHWRDTIDVMIICDSNAMFTEPEALRSVAILPCMPYEQPEGFVPSPRDIDVCMIGSNKRERWLYAATLGSSQLRFHINLHQRDAQNCPDRLDYFRTLARSRCVFSCGTREFNGVFANGSITGRPFETILGGGLVLHEDNFATEEFLTPFVHYIPLRSAQELVIYGQYFADAESAEDWTRITTAAHNLYRERYAPPLFWKWIINKYLTEFGVPKRS